MNANVNARGSGSDDFWLVPIVFVIALGVVLYWAGRLSALLAGTGHLHGHEFAEFTAFAHLNDPSLAWHANVGSPGVYLVPPGPGADCRGHDRSRRVVACVTAERPDPRHAG